MTPALQDSDIHHGSGAVDGQFLPPLSPLSYVGFCGLRIGVSCPSSAPGPSIHMQPDQDPSLSLIILINLELGL